MSYTGNTPKKVLELIRIAKETSKTFPCCFQDKGYFPLDPQPDTDEICHLPRLIFKHSAFIDPDFFWVPAGMIYAGWVIGIGLA